MEKRQAYSGTYKSSVGHTIKMNIPIIIFEEDKNQIVYCPALDISGYGSSEAEAKESFETCLSEFFSYTLHKKTFFDVLKELGWTMKNSKHKPMMPPSMSKMLNENKNAVGSPRLF